MMDHYPKKNILKSKSFTDTETYKFGLVLLVKKLIVNHLNKSSFDTLQLSIIN